MFTRYIGNRLLLLATLLFSAATAPSVPAVGYALSSQIPPAPLREFRGAWVASVGNINWPSKPGLSTAAQRAELIALLDRAVSLRLNAIIFQVRPCCDAFYPSRIEPWSEYLTGTMGQPPQPFYDPLEFAITEAHRRGLELHAWFNPYRARHTSAISPVTSRHVSKTRPQLVRTYGKHLWLDPGEPAVRDYSLSVVMDVVRRYDIDGVHFDDYFYPYQEKDSAGATIEFPDDSSWRKYGGKSGLNRPDWRRENVNQFIQRAYVSVHGLKPWVKFGLSPFGIWRPGNPAPIRGLDAYDKLYADARKWLVNGWMDYCAPQLYWPIEPKAQSFTTLLDWWRAQNPTGRHIWPGLNSMKVGASGWNPSEIVSQIQVVRSRERLPGEIHWSIGALTADHSDLGATLARQCYAQPALVPSCSWLAASRPSQPRVAISDAPGGKLRLAFQPAPRETAARWVLQMKGRDGVWTTHIVAGTITAVTLSSVPPDALAVTLIDRFSNPAPTVVLERRN
jgi:uncharacterized lipoprotein YddW (UPF0748 family)